MGRKKTTLEFIKEAQLIHGYKYNYSLVEYIRGSDKVLIECPIHGKFLQTPNTHIQGRGCKKCYDENHRLTKSKFKGKACEVHDFRYDYSLIKEVSNTSKVDIICPIHGIFKQNARNHLNGAGCPKCYGKFKYSNEEFIIKAKSKHGNTYDYSKVNYKTAHKKVKIICKIHGEFIQKAYSHLLGTGCPKCGIKERVELKRDSTQDFITKAKLRHGDSYKYDLVEYGNNNADKVIILCNIHGKFEQTPNRHLAGQGCPECSISGFKKNLPAILYYIKYKDFYKIGVTNNSVQERYGSKKMKHITILEEIYFESGEEAYNKELEIKQQNKDFLYNKFNQLTESCSTELFTRNILNIN